MPYRAVVEIVIDDQAVRTEEQARQWIAGCLPENLDYEIIDVAEDGQTIHEA